jgi:hypothetical protein
MLRVVIRPTAMERATIVPQYEIPNLPLVPVDKACLRRKCE